MKTEEYLAEHKITTDKLLKKHLEELKRNTFVDVELIDSLINFFAKKSPPSRTINSMFLDEIVFLENSALNKGMSTRHKANQEKKVIEDWNKKEFHSTILTKENLEKMSDSFLDRVKNNSDRCGILKSLQKQETSAKDGKKEKEGKLHYELSWEFIEEMAKRMANNKSDKYPLYNWKKNIDIEDLKQAINRHHIEVMKGNYQDGDEVLGHIVQYACNSMMLWEQLNKS